MNSNRRLVSIILCQAAALMMTGLLWGVILPIAPHGRLALGAHIQFTGNAVMLAAAAFCIHYLDLGQGRASRRILIFTPWLIWPMALSEVANAWWGTAKVLAISAAEAGVTGGAPWQEALVGSAHIIAGLGQIAFWAVILGGAIGNMRDSR